MFLLDITWAFLYQAADIAILTNSDRWLCKTAEIKAREFRFMRRTSVRRIEGGAKRNAGIGHFTKPSRGKA